MTPKAFPVHPTALMVGADLGMDTKSMREIISMAADDNPMLLIGGYNIDVMIIAAVAVMSLEDQWQQPGGRIDDWSDTDRELIRETVNEMLQVFAVKARLI